MGSPDQPVERLSMTRSALRPEADTLNQTVRSRCTPPDPFVVQGVRESSQLRDVMFGAAPFVVTLLAIVVLLISNS